MDIRKPSHIKSNSKLILTSCILAFLIGSTQAETLKTDKPIRIIKNDWTSQLVMAEIVGGIFSYLGYNIEYSTSSTNQQWGALAQGVDHVQVEVWQGTMADMFNRMVSAKRILDAGAHDAKTREEWWYPIYIEEQCPGLPDWKALKRCAQLFKTDASGEKGHYYAGPWEKPEAAKIRALDLNFKAIQVKQADDLWAALKQAQQDKKPIVLFNWTPNWVEARFEGKFIEFPTYDVRCETDPSWGVNPDYHYDCGNPKDGWLKKAAWSGMPTTWPCAYQTLKNLNFTNNMISQLAAQVDIDKKSTFSAAQDWLQQNHVLWKSWVPSDCSL